MKNVLLVINPVSGRKLAQKKIFDIVSVFCEHGISPTVHITQGRGDAGQYVLKNAGKFDAVVSGGGDGTMNEAASGVLESGAGVPFGHIPFGSTDVFAQCHGIPKDPAQAAAVICRGRTIKIDTARFNGRRFIYIASFGAFSDLSFTTSQQMKNVLGHGAYLVDSVKEFQHIVTHGVCVECDGETREGSYGFGAVSNVTSVASVIKMPEGSVISDDGKFETVLIKKPDTPAGWSSVAASIMSGEYDPEYFEFLHGSSIRLACAESIDWALDGEKETASSVEIEVDRQSLEVFVP